MDKTPASDAPGHRLVGRYQLVSPVVSGALGELWRARIVSGPEEGRVVLARLIPRGPEIDARAVERLTNAGFAAMELRHAKIAAVLDVVVADAEIAIVSEHIAGAALQSVARQTGPKRIHPTPAVSLRIVADVLEALDAVRAPWAELTADPDSDDERLLARGIHGGLTLDDLLVASFGETMLLEAGLAGVAMTLTSISEHPEVIAYRAPEQIEAKEPVDERADVFTVGVIAWELLAGRSLFGPMLLPRPVAPGVPGGPVKLKPLAEAAQTSSVKRKVLSAPVQRLDTLPLLKGKITKEFASWVARCLERDRAARFQTLRDALTELQALGPALFAPAADVSKWIVACGVPLDVPPESATEPAPASNRPTTPPEDAPARAASSPNGASADEPPTAPATTPRGGPSAAIHLKATTPMGVKSPFATGGGAARPLAPADVAALTVESLMPSDSVPPPGAPSNTVVDTDVESIPPSSIEVESIPPSSSDETTLPPATTVDVESIPPSSSDVPTLPPAIAASSLPLEVEATSVESVPPFSTEPTLISAVPREPASPVKVVPMAPVNVAPVAPVNVALPVNVAPVASDAARGAFPPVAPAAPMAPVAPVATEERTAARAADAVADPGPDEVAFAAERRRLAARRRANKRIVEYVMGGAAAVVVAAILRLLIGGRAEPGTEQPAASGKPSITTPVASAAPAAPAAPAVVERAPAAVQPPVPVVAAVPAEPQAPEPAPAPEPPPAEPSPEPTNPSPPANAKAPPTLAPAPAGVVAKPPGNKKKTYRPTGI